MVREAGAGRNKRAGRWWWLIDEMAVWVSNGNGSMSFTTKCGVSKNDVVETVVCGKSTGTVNDFWMVITC